MCILQRSVQELKGVGTQVALRLQKLQIKTLQDVLFHLPYKYVDRTRVYPLSTIRADDTVVVEGVIEKITVVPNRAANLVVKIKDSTGSAELRFFILI